MNVKLLFISLMLTYHAFTALNPQERFRSCAAAFLDDQIIVTEYTNNGICEVSSQATGILTVQTADLSPEESMPTGKLKFRLAIQDGETGTIWSYSDKTYKEIPIRDVLGKCRVGDQIVLLTVVDEYALPHSRITVKE
ncbi:MAG: hypothetical protein H6561_03090 [Lewinellaceae bacterium]|nr:hypothetical protein [Lewinellaceae bacterium]HPQ99314.1 hypothetical protein [Saprospiraceae bacterium]